MRQKGHWLPFKALTRLAPSQKNMSHYYSNSEDKQGQETKRQKKSQHEEQTEQVSLDRHSIRHFIQPLHVLLGGGIVEGFT